MLPEMNAPQAAAQNALSTSPDADYLATQFLNAGRELCAGLLPDEIEDQLLTMEDASLRSTIEQAIVKHHLTGDAFDNFFADRPRGTQAFPLIPFSEDRAAWRGFVMTGKHSFESGDKCKCDEVDYSTIVRGAFAHSVAKKKDGLWFSPCRVDPVARANDNVQAIYGACIDVDDGTPAEEVLAGIAKAGIGAVVASSFSNMKTVTAIAASKVREMTTGGKSAAEILMEVKGYRVEVAGGSTLGEVVKAKGRKGQIVEEWLIHHQPCPKLRVFVPYSKPLLASDFKSHREFVAAHKRRYRAVPKLIGVENHDKMCENPARIFFTARHPKGAPFFNIELPGRFIDPNEPELLALVPEEEKPSKSSAESHSVSGKESHVGGGAAFEGGDFNFKLWAACGFADNFLLIDALQARQPDAFFDDAGTNWLAIHCPHDAHEQNGGTHVKNADPSAPKGLRGFCIDCKHNTCAGEPTHNDRLAHLAKMVGIGWLSKADLTAREFFAGSEAEYAHAMLRFRPQPLPEPFARTAHGICHVTPGEDNKKIFERICDEFTVIGESKNEHGEDHSVIIEFSSDGVFHRERVPMALVQGDPKRIRESLAGKGLRIDGSSRAKGHFDTLISRVASDQRLLTVSRPGFHTWQNVTVFTAPNGQSIDAAGQRADVTLADAATMKNCASRGSHGNWYASQEAVAKAGNPHWIIGACSGFCGPLINLLELDSTGIALIGETSTGKSLGQGMGAAVWGDPDPNKGHGLFRSARTTDNGLESRAARSHGSLLAVDDLAHADPKMVGKFVFMLASGSGKERMNSDASARGSTTWATYYTLSSERSISDLISMGGTNMLSGHAVRLPTVNVTGARIVPPAELSAIEAYKVNYGHAWQPFIEKLFKSDYVTEPSKLLRRLDDMVAALCGPQAHSTDRRAARPFALLWLGGEIARDSGALPLIMDVESAVRWAWESYRGGTEAEALSPMDRAISTMRANVQAAWDTDLPRLTSIDLNSTDVVCGVGTAEETARQYRPTKWGWYDDLSIYILRGKLAELAGNTDTAQAVAKALKVRGFLTPNSDRLFHKYLPGRGEVEHYRLRRAEFLGADSEVG